MLHSELYKSQITHYTDPDTYKHLQYNTDIECQVGLICPVTVTSYREDRKIQNFAQLKLVILLFPSLVCHLQLSQLMKTLFYLSFLFIVIGMCVFFL